MPTYKQVQDEVKRSAGFVPKSCWIAHVKSMNALPTREAYNRHDSEKRVHPCPPEKRGPIEDALRKLGAFTT